MHIEPTLSFPPRSWRSLMSIATSQLQASIPFVVSVQSSLFDRYKRRVVAPLMLRQDLRGQSSAGKAASHAGQTTLYLTPMHGKASILKSLIANIRAALQHVRVTAEQFKTTDPWTVLMRYVSDRIAPSLGPFRPPDALPATG